MTFYYDGAHSVKFGDYDSWKDWHLIPSSRPVIAPPSERTTFVEIPGRNGKLDLSWALTGGPVYDNRTGNLEFYVDHNQWHGWHTAYATIMKGLQGRRIKVILSDDPSFYYEGLCWIDKWNSSEKASTISIKYDFYPYKKRIMFPEKDWLWDPFDFENGIIGPIPSGEEEAL